MFMQPLPPVPALLLICRSALARALMAATSMLLAATLAACTSSGTPSAEATRSAGSGNPASSDTSRSPDRNSTGTATTASSGTGTAAKKKAISGLITFNGILQLTGATTQRLSFSAFPGVTSPASSCARIAANGTPAPAGQEPRFAIPSPPAGSTVYFVASVSPYHGPGTYSKASILAVGSSFMVGDAAYNPLAATATATITFRANGSGIFTFRNAAAAKPATGAISGSISWTCSG